MSGVVEALLEKYGTAIELDFVRSPSGAVHVRYPALPSWAEEEKEENSADTDEAIALLSGRTRMIFGLVRFVDYVGENHAKFTPVGAFADDDLCAGCYRALGSHSVRAFEHPRPGDGD
jgi:hypothetical protein